MNFDKTFCASPHCKNECGRLMKNDEKEYLKQAAWRGLKTSNFICYSYFCGEPNLKTQST